MPGQRGEHTKDERNVVVEIELGYTLGHTLADICEMRCLALYHTSQADDAVEVIIFGKPLGCEGDLKGAGDMPDNDVVIGRRRDCLSVSAAPLSSA